MTTVRSSRTAAPAHRSPRERRGSYYRMSAITKKTGVYAILMLLVIVTIFPLAWMLLTSLTPQDETFGSIIPSTLDGSAYQRAWTAMNFPQAFKNTVEVTVMTVTIVVAVSTLTGYAFARLAFPGREIVFYLFLSAMMVPGAAILVPMFIFLKDINLVGTSTGLAVSYLGGALPFATFLMRAFFKTLPTELGDAGKMDGCSEFGVFSRVYLPLTGPGIATITIFQFMGTWNEFMFANTFLAAPDSKTLQAALYQAVGQYSTDWPALTAGLTMATVPIVIVYLALQRQFISGMTAGALKG
jgi:ABC-type glycerol-3-phosphate transport system permease component